MRAPRPGVPKLHQTAGWSARRSTIVSSRRVERDRVVDTERRRRRVGTEADAVPELAFDVLRPAGERRAAVAADDAARRRARRSRSGSGSRCRAGTDGRCRCCAVARARSARWRRRRRPAHRLGDARPASDEGEEVVAPWHDCSGRARRSCAAGLRTLQSPQGSPCPCNTDVSAGAASRSASFRSARGSRTTRRSTSPRRKEMLAVAMDAGVNFFDNAEVYAQGQSEVVMGEAIRALEVAAPALRRLDQVLLGPRARGQHRQPHRHAQPQVPDAGDRRLAAAHAARLHRPRLLPPRRPAHADRGDGLGDERHDHARQGALLGNERVDARPTSAPPGRSPSATICTSR